MRTRNFAAGVVRVRSNAPARGLFVSGAVLPRLALPPLSRLLPGLHSSLTKAGFPGLVPG